MADNAALKSQQVQRSDGEEGLHGKLAGENADEQDHSCRGSQATVTGSCSLVMVFEETDSGKGSLSIVHGCCPSLRSKKFTSLMWLDCRSGLHEPGEEFASVQCLWLGAGRERN